MERMATSRLSTEQLRQIAEDGYAVTIPCLDVQAICDLSSVLDTSHAGERNLLDVPVVRRLAGSSVVRGLIEPVLGSGCFAVRGILFNKTEEANWRVVWHQDCVIAVAERKKFRAGDRGRSRLALTTFVRVPILLRECWRSASIWMSAERTTALCE